MKRRDVTRRWAFGNKRQKAKVRRFHGTWCGCFLCDPPDRRHRLLRRELVEDMQCYCLPYAKPYDGMCERCMTLRELDGEVPS